MKVLVIGSKGLAGHIIKCYLENEKYDVYSTYRNKNKKKLGEKEFDLDVFDKERLNEILEKVKPNFVINCVGILNAEAERNPDVAIYVNGYIPHYLDRLSLNYNYKLIHISTDCVFSGKKGGYKEDDLKDADSYYGRSKGIGEINNNRALTIRTSIIGPDINENGIGLFNWFMKQKGQIKGYSKVYWTGVTTLELAKAIKFSLENDSVGIIHLVNNEKISKYELLKLFVKYMDRHDVIIESDDSYKSDKSLIKTKMKFNYEVPSYEKMVEQMVEWIKKNRNIYQI